MTTIDDTQLSTVLKSAFGIDPSADAPDTTLDEMGVDSLVIVELLLEIQKVTGVRLDEGEILPTHTVGQVVDLVNAKDPR